MLLIPEQIRFLRNSIRALEAELKEHENYYFEKKEFTKIENSSRIQTMDHIIEDGYKSKL